MNLIFTKHRRPAVAIVAAHICGVHKLQFSKALLPTIVLNLMVFILTDDHLLFPQRLPISIK